MQVPIGLEEDFKGLIDLVQQKAYFFHGYSGSVSKTGVLFSNENFLFFPNIYHLLSCCILQ